MTCLPNKQEPPEDPFRITISSCVSMTSGTSVSAGWVALQIQFQTWLTWLPFLFLDSFIFPLKLRRVNFYRGSDQFGNQTRASCFAHGNLQERPLFVDGRVISD